MLRLAFLSWYRENEPGWLTGLDAELPAVAELVEEVGSEAALGAEARFTLGLLLWFRPPVVGDEDAARRTGRTWVESAAALEPTSRLFREWRYLLAEAEDTLGARTHVDVEIHARYGGRGALGAYLTHTLRARLRPDGHPQAAI